MAIIKPKRPVVIPEKTADRWLIHAIHIITPTPGGRTIVSVEFKQYSESLKEFVGLSKEVSLDDLFGEAAKNSGKNIYAQAIPLVIAAAVDIGVKNGIDIELEV